MQSKKCVLSQSIAAIVCVMSTFSSTQVVAADDEAKLMEEVVVSGFRGSLEKARDAKREAVNVRESIMAEDIGKFPDLNIAESIQRVPGVQVSREGGEGRNITLRGLGPDFTRTTLNGMEVPAGSDGLDSGGISLNSGRAFDFHVFASELFNRVDIQKTQTASIEEGGIAGTVDLYSAKPFDFDGFRASASLQNSYNDLTGENDPRGALLVSNTFADGRFGVLASVAYSERTVRQQGFGSVRWTSPYLSNDSWEAVNPVVNGTPAGDCPAADPLDCLWAPRLPRADFFGNDQERTGITTAFQFRPNEKSEITLDVLHSELKNDRESYNSMEWFITHGAPSVPTDFTGATPLEFTIDSSGKVLRAASFDNVTSWYESRLQNSDSKFDQYVLSGEYEFNETISMDAMVGWAENEADRDELRFYYRSEPHPYSYDYSNNEIASVSYGGWDPQDPNNFLDVVNASYRNQKVRKENLTSKWDLTFAFDKLSIKAGLAYNDREVESEQFEGNRGFTVDPTIYGRAFPYSDFGDGLSGPDLQPFLVADWGALSRDGIIPPGYTKNVPAGWLVGEETMAAYIEANNSVELGEMTLRMNFGIRWVDTTVTSEAVVGGFPLSVERNYQNWLPSMNLALEVTEDVVTRLAFGRTMTRPSLNSLTIAQPNFGITTSTVSGLGNPDLNPYESNDFDVGVEWYFGEEGMLAATYFQKDVVTSLETQTVSKFVDPEYWPVIYNDPQYDPAFNNDPALVPWTHSIPVNTTDGFTVSGYEIAWQQPFTFFNGWASNFGVAANYTHVNAGDLKGVSEESYNFTLYYEEDDYGARISVNSRDDYLLDAPSANGNVSEWKYGPTHVDFSSFWHFNDNLTFSLEIINLTDEEERIYGTGDGTLDVTREYSHTGAQYLLGVRYSM